MNDPYLPAGTDLHEKYGLSHTGHDIYDSIFGEAMAAILRSPTSMELARYVVAVVNLDLPQVEECTFLVSMSAQDPELVANWRAKNGRRQ
jgi:hypothetical protein